MSRETPIIRDILDALDLYPRLLWAWRCNSGKVRVRGGWMQLSPKGTADILGYWLADARTFGIEVKAPDDPEPLSEEQRKWGARLTAAGGLYLVVNSVAQALGGLMRAPQWRRAA